jgi:hypothetical protein
MILLPDMVPKMELFADELFPALASDAPDSPGDEPVDSPRRVAARMAIERLQEATVESVKTGDLPRPDTAVRSEFSQKHPLFGVHIATRTTSAPAGSVVVGAVHKYPTLNVLLKGKVIMASEHGKRTLVAPCMYMQEANIKKAGLVLEDCELANIMMMPESYADPLEAESAVRSFHTAPNYADVGIVGLAIQKIEG